MVSKWKSYLGGHSVIKLKKSSGEVYPSKKSNKRKIKVNGKKDARNKYFNILVDSIINDCLDPPSVPQFIKDNIRHKSLTNLYKAQSSIKYKNKDAINFWFNSFIKDKSLSRLKNIKKKFKKRIVDKTFNIYIKTGLISVDFPPCWPDIIVDYIKREISSCGGEEKWFRETEVFKKYIK